jgi:manganese/iron transport system permease protein
MPGIAVAVGSSALGTLVSFHIDGATGPCIVLIQAAIFLLAFFFSGRRGGVPAEATRTASGPAPVRLPTPASIPPES